MDFFVADGHCDFLYGMVNWGYDITAPKPEQTIRLADMQRGNVALQFFAAWTDMSLKRSPLSQCMAMMDAYERILEEHEELVPLTSDFIPGRGKIATVITIEGGESLEGSLAVLRQLWRTGICAVGLTWNANNELSGAALARGNKGLTDRGRDIIREMADLGMAIDLAHLSDHAIEDILEMTDAPVFASHSNARAVCDSPRSLKDDYIREIARRGGTVGVNFYPPQLSGRKDACIDDMVRHIRHIIDVGGEDCCAIGSDLDGMTHYPADFHSSADFPKLADALLRSGLSENTVQKVFYENLRNYIIQFV